MLNDWTTTVCQEPPILYLPEVMGSSLGLTATGRWQLSLILDLDPQTLQGPPLFSQIPYETCSQIYSCKNFGSNLWGAEESRIGPREELNVDAAVTEVWAYPSGALALGKPFRAVLFGEEQMCCCIQAGSTLILWGRCEQCTAWSTSRNLDDMTSRRQDGMSSCSAEYGNTDASWLFELMEAR